MKLNFFKLCKCVDEAKILYRQLALKFHPDRIGGDSETMKLINAEYDFAITKLPRFWKDGSTKTYKTNEERNAEDESDIRYREKVMAIINLEGLIVEYCGAWIWVTGETVTHKKTLKSNGFYWASQKKAWYWRPAEHRSQNRNKYTMDEIRQYHGSERVMQEKREEKQRITA